MQDYDAEKAAAEIAGKLDRGRYPEFAGQFDALIRSAVAFDLAFMRETGAAYYDDDEAFEYILEGVARERGWDEDKMLRLGALIDDYMEAQESYMEAAGLLEWE
ncbi:MAG: hypothetical protein FWE77_04500 [Clostridia bacterium]|nr:hypothetical protein [Clostridia bacterium]